MHVEERGGLFQIQCVHHSVESRINDRLFPELQCVEPSQDRRAAPPRRVVEASVMEVSVLAHIHTRDVASTTVPVA
jgi:hypothetical protein